MHGVFAMVRLLVLLCIKNRAAHACKAVSAPALAPLATESAVPHDPAHEPALPAAVYRPPVFHGYECTEDCSGHEAGYDWAERHDVDDPDDCGGNSQSFIEGQSYAEEHQQERKEDEQSDEETDDD